jgi:hypothetical protein
MSPDAEAELRAALRDSDRALELPASDVPAHLLSPT